MEETHAASSSYGNRSMRSTVTMLKYLGRTSSEARVDEVVQQSARCEGSLSEQRRRVGKLRYEQEKLESQLQDRVAICASSLQADASAKAAAKARAAQAARHSDRLAEHAARVMGAVAPHRASARGAALAVVAPLEWRPSSPPRSPLGTDQSVSKSLSQRRRGSDKKPSVSLRPGRYCLRSCHNGPGRARDPMFFSCTSAGLALCRCTDSLPRQA